MSSCFKVFVTIFTINLQPFLQELFLLTYSQPISYIRSIRQPCFSTLHGSKERWLIDPSFVRMTIGLVGTFFLNSPTA
jgi:hypothetical protein